MPRPTSKATLLAQGKLNFDKLISHISNLDQKEKNKEFAEGYMNRNIGDVLMHLHEWHLMILGWHKEGMAGKKQEMPAPGYTWKTVPDLNRKIWSKHQHVPFEESLEKVKESYLQLRELINSHSDEELFEKKKYKWTGSTSMGAYFISASSSHYDWALKLIKKASK